MPLVAINNRNRLTTTKAMVEYLECIPNAAPVIVDNDSTYPPLLEWYEHCPVPVIRARKNLGPHAPWMLCSESMSGGDYVVTDSDLDLLGVPIDLLEVLASGLLKYPDVIKAGLSLEIDDLPAEFDSTRLIQKWETRHWQTRLTTHWWDADVDTTFAMYRAGTDWTDVKPAIRADRPYTARHIPWYRIMDDEEKYIEDHCDTQWSTWARWEEQNPARDKVAEALGLQ